MIQPTVFDGPHQLGVAIARTVVDGILRAAAEGRSFLLGCPGGRTGRPVYAAIAQLVSREVVPISNLVIIMMDEYLTRHGDDQRLILADPDAHYSCRRFGSHEILDVLNAGLPEADRVPNNSLWVPDPASPEGYDDAIEAAGGIDLFLLASGASDGHVAFCGPGSDRYGKTSVVKLAETTRIDNLSTFPLFTSVDEVPTHGVTVGLGTISDLSKSVILVAHGEEKRETVRWVRGATAYDASWPATIIQGCRQADFYVDRAAIGGNSD